MFKHTYKPDIKINSFLLLLITVLTILSILLLNLTIHKSLSESHDHMLSASNKMKLAYKEIYNYRLDKGLAVSKIYDPNQTGFIGKEFSPITTTLGNLDAKQIALNPDFAALMIKWMKKLNVTAGDTAVIHASASFPALTIMAIIAADELNLIPVIFSSVGASSWGANIPEMTYLDIENQLYKKNIIKHRSNYVTPGGTNDNGSSLWDGGLEEIQQAANRNNYILQIPTSLASSISSKWELIKEIKPGLFINIGGNHAAMGEAECAMKIPVGLITEPLHCSNTGVNGLIYECRNANIPVIHFLKLKDIAFSNGIDISSFSFENPRNSDIYYQKKISIPIAIISFLMIFSLVIIFRKKFAYNNPSNSRTISTNLK